MIQNVYISVTLADNLEEARACLARSQPDLVIADLLLPDGQGIELLSTKGGSRTRDKIPAFPMVLMTSFGNEHVAAEAIKAGALDYVVKSKEAPANPAQIAPCGQVNRLSLQGGTIPLDHAQRAVQGLRQVFLSRYRSLANASSSSR